MAQFDQSATIQKDFQSAMLTEMKESPGGQLKDIGEMRSVTGAESTFFNRATGGTASATAPSMFGQADVGTGGAARVVEVKPSFAHAFDKMKDEQVYTTSVSYKGWIPRELTRQLEVNEDEKILAALAAEKANLTPIGVPATALENQLEVIIGAAKTSILSAGVTPDKRKFVKMVMNVNTYEKLFTTDLAINNDYLQISGMNGVASDGIASFYGCQVIVIKEASTHLADGEIFFIPAMTLGFAEWAGSNHTSAKYYESDGDTWHFTAKKSFGVGVLEPAAIKVFSSTIA